jgi:hypothetical protein
MSLFEIDQAVGTDERHDRAQGLHAGDVNLEVVAQPLDLLVLLHLKEPPLSLFTLELIAPALDSDEDLVKLGKEIFEFLIHYQVRIIFGFVLKLR